jgi:hypothetical protein
LLRAPVADVGVQFPVGSVDGWNAAQEQLQLVLIEDGKECAWQHVVWLPVQRLELLAHSAEHLVLEQQL